MTKGGSREGKGGAPIVAVPEASSSHSLVAIEVSDVIHFTLSPLTSDRPWMRETPDGFARRCLPLLLANQMGWAVATQVTVEAEWDGGAQIEALKVITSPKVDDPPAVSHFGAGVVTWVLPYLFRTSPRFDLLVRGPANEPRDGIAPLEGLVETGWSPATFTMNWIFTRPGRVVFEAGAIVCALLPVRHDDINQFAPAILPFDCDPNLTADYLDWRESRQRFLQTLRSGDPIVRIGRGWQGDYLRGDIGGVRPCAPQHRRLSVRPFVRCNSPEV
jgi:hypothetical protein